MNFRSGIRTLALSAVCGAALAGCSTIDGLFSEKKGPPLPGARVAVLLQDEGISPDRALAEVKIELPKPAANPAWPQPGGYPNHAMHHLALGPAPQRAWSSSIGNGSGRYQRLLAQPVLGDGLIFTMDAAARVRAFSADAGSQLWSVEVLQKSSTIFSSINPLNWGSSEGGELGGGVAYADGLVVVTTGQGDVLALDAKSGKEVWRTPAAAPFRAAPTVANGRIFAVTVENELIVFDLKKGEKLWSFAGTPETTTILGGASPAVD
ncbi:MAG: PQQ-binding-like beta-propeller repeat protein, partial [Alphaproteobacteria bacterium]